MAAPARKATHMPQIKIITRGEWQWLCLVFEQLCHPFQTVRFIGKSKAQYVIPDIEGMTGQQPIITIQPKDIIEITLDHNQSVRFKPNQNAHGNIVFTIQKEQTFTHITVDYDSAEDEEQCNRILSILIAVAEKADKYKTEGDNIKAEQLIKQYYEAKQKGDKLTLRQLAQAYGFNESYLRQVHQKYKRTLDT